MWQISLMQNVLHKKNAQSTLNQTQDTFKIGRFITGVSCFCFSIKAVLVIQVPGLVKLVFFKLFLVHKSHESITFKYI